VYLQLRVCEDTVCPLLSAGVMFQMPHIVKSCCTFLEHQLDPSESFVIMYYILKRDRFWMGWS